jgi:hypothetical protein
MEDVGNREVVAKRRHDQGKGREKDGSEDYDAGAAGSLGESLGLGIVGREERKQTCAKAIYAQRQGEEQGKVAYQCHEGEPQVIFSESQGEGNRQQLRTIVSGGHVNDSDSTVPYAGRDEEWRKRFRGGTGGRGSAARRVEG